MSLFLLNVLLALAWVALVGRFDGTNFAAGFILGYLILWLIFRNSPQARYFLQVPRILKLVTIFSVDVIKANIRMAITVLSPKMNLQPGVVGVPLDLRHEAGLILLTNMITLTPGTLTLDVSGDRRMLFIHSLWLEDKDEFIRDIKQGYEQQLIRIFES